MNVRMWKMDIDAQSKGQQKVFTYIHLHFRLFWAVANLPMCHMIEWFLNSMNRNIYIYLCIHIIYWEIEWMTLIFHHHQHIVRRFFLSCVCRCACYSCRRNARLDYEQANVFRMWHSNQMNRTNYHYYQRQCISTDDLFSIHCFMAITLTLVPSVHSIAMSREDAAHDNVQFFF